MATTTTSYSQQDKMTPEQRQFFEQMFTFISPEVMQQIFGQTFGQYSDAAQGIMGMAQGVDEERLREGFQKRIADPAMQQFQEEVVPFLQERFTAMGSGGGPTEQTSLATAGQRLNESLAQQYEDTYQAALDRQLKAAGVVSDISTQQMQSAYPYIKDLYSTETYENIATQTTKDSPWESFMGGVGKGVGSAASAYFGSKLPGKWKLPGKE